MRGDELTPRKTTTALFLLSVMTGVPLEVATLLGQPRAAQLKLRGRRHTSASRTRYTGCWRSTLKNDAMAGDIWRRGHALSLRIAGMQRSTLRN
jgi:hypothetical protein